MTLSQLIERCESGSGPDRELDSDVLDALNDPAADKTWPFVEGSYAASITPPITSSLDAVVSLIEQKLPEITDNSAADFLAASIEEMMIQGWRPSEPNAPQICRAVLAGFLRALQSKEASHDA